MENFNFEKKKPSNLLVKYNFFDKHNINSSKKHFTPGNFLFIKFLVFPFEAAMPIRGYNKSRS